MLTGLAKDGAIDERHEDQVLVRLADVQANRAIPMPPPLHSHVRHGGDATVRATGWALSASVGAAHNPPTQPRHQMASPVRRTGQATEARTAQPKPQLHTVGQRS